MAFGAAPPALSSASRASTSAPASSSSSSLNCESRLDAAISCWPSDHGLLAADLLLEATDLARRVHDVDRLHGVVHLLLGLRGLRAGDELVALARELAELRAHAVEALLELVDDLVLRRDGRLGVLRLVLGRDLLAEGDLREVVELVGVGGVATGAQLVALGARREGLATPVAGGLDVLLVVLLHEAQVADGLGDGALGLRDAVRVVTHELVEHELGVLGGVEERVDVRAQQLADATEDGLLGQ